MRITLHSLAYGGRESVSWENVWPLQYDANLWAMKVITRLKGWQNFSLQKTARIRQHLMRMYPQPYDYWYPLMVNTNSQSWGKEYHDTIN